MTNDRGWIQTYTGKRFWPLSPEKGEICIEDISWALSNMPRFTGHCNRFYSVAEHCLKVSQHCPRGLKLAGLLHDASEAYLCDIASPVKHHEEFGFYRKAESHLQARINDELGVGFIYATGRTEVKRWDNIVTAAEALILMAPLDPELFDWAAKIMIRRPDYPDVIPAIPRKPPSQNVVCSLYLSTYRAIKEGL